MFVISLIRVTTLPPGDVTKEFVKKYQLQIWGLQH